MGRSFAEKGPFSFVEISVNLNLDDYPTVVEPLIHFPSPCVDGNLSLSSSYTDMTKARTLT
jgi:hypothetical protein